MRSSILICATCLVVTGCSAQLRFPSLSSALSSLTGFGSGASSSGASSASQGQSASSAYSGLMRDYGRNLMMAMSSIYPSIFKPPQASGQQQQAQSPLEQFAASQPLQSLFSAASNSGPASAGSGSSGPSFTFGGSTFSISPSLPFGSLGGGSASGHQGQQGPPSGPQQASAGSHSPFSASFGSSINSPASFGPLSSAPFFQSQSMPSFAPSSYGAAFDSANGGPAFGQSPSFQSAPGQQASAQQISSYQPLGSSFGSQPFDTAAGSIGGPGGAHQSAGLGVGSHQSAFMQSMPGQSGPSGGQLSQQSPQPAASAPQPAQVGPQQFGPPHHSAQQYRPDMMSVAASSSVPSSNSYSNYGNIPSGSGQQAPVSSSYQQPSYR